mmetsp:Transcript_8338/g.12792  ORF Transcript_8338/g.12792 Transcript_8338/m.12792 type:complete len:402 (-) Transcript_8338:352-1557(-)|eukprot:CAMPEP_0195294786 /NCGR_PEP_ID=MMETSP0707-20130614/15879_1 /TAXON_ID=33640 /ORGANISM="Asterionellopsis glacialis, Strain CCMP134" /LENGTH=401 /DNA_ID=CAMNT_0040355845 /DNA_START=135 /DNA_END=1340 /DNA_ORIENTATION=+
MTETTAAANNNDNAQAKVSKKERRPRMWKVWVQAARPHTLTAAFSPILAGYNLCASEIQKTIVTNDDPDGLMNGTDMNSWLRKQTFAWLLFCVFVQIGTNLHNDYADFVKGADNEHRVGQARATQKGWLTPRQTATASTMCLMVTFAIGIQLSQLPNASGNWDWFALGITATSVFNAFAYTGGPYPLGYIGLSNFSIGYSGLGDLFVFLYFGLVATMALPYLYSRDVLSMQYGGGQTAGEILNRMFSNPESEMATVVVPHILIKAFYVALPVGWLGTAIIVVNNLRDRHTDVFASKLTTSVRFGELFSRVQYALLVLGSYCVLPLVLLSDYHFEDNYNGDTMNIISWCFLPCLTLPMAIPQLRAVTFGEKDGADLNPHVGGTALLQFAYCIFFGISLRILR